VNVILTPTLYSTEFQIDGLCRTFALKSSTRVLSFEYRKAPEYSLLAGRADIEEGLLFASRNYSRVILGGESAGATFALSVAIQYPDLIMLVLLAYPVLEKGIDYVKLKKAWIIDVSVLNWFTSHNCAIGDQENGSEQFVVRELFRVRVDLISRLPPTHIISAGLDALQIGSINLEKTLRRAGVSVVHDRHPESDHGFLSFGIDQSEEAIENAARRIRHMYSPKREKQHLQGRRAQ
jgi:acetyl esterase